MELKLQMKNVHFMVGDWRLRCESTDAYMVGQMKGGIPVNRKNGDPLHDKFVGVNTYVDGLRQIP